MDKNRLYKSETSCKYVSSRGILKSCDIYSKTPISSLKKLIDYDFSKIEDGSIVYICNTALINNVNFLDNIDKKIILVSGDSDETITEKINSDKIIQHFSQNCITNTINQIPIGMDYHTLCNGDHRWGKQKFPKEQEINLINIKFKSKPFFERKIAAYSNFHFSINYDRLNAFKKIPRNLVYYEPSHIERYISWTRQSDFAFVISPHGNGLDCHRTYEALNLGCIVIVKTSGLDKLYEDLPVLIVEKWNDITFDLLYKTVISYKEKKFNYNKLKLKYWMNIIKSHKFHQPLFIK